MRLTKEDRIQTGELKHSELKHNPRYIVKIEDGDAFTWFGLTEDEYNNFNEHRSSILEKYLKFFD